jgi:biopolymer transport protein ExbB
MENAAIHEVAHLEKYLTVLATIANIAPLLGFLGTVVGMILSFEVIATQGLNDPGAVAKGISVALLTTAYGLIVAFVTQPFYNYFTSQINAHTREIETAANILFETFDEMDARKASPQAV